MRRLFPIVYLAIFLVPEPALAEGAITWFALTPDAVTEVEQDVPLTTGFVYSRFGRYDAVAKLKQPYLLDAQKPDGPQIAAGEELMLTLTKKSAFYCSRHVLAQTQTADVLNPGTILGAALGVQLFGGNPMPRKTQMQCFRDADKDGSFDEVGSGLGGPQVTAHVVNISDIESLTTPLPYEVADPSPDTPQIEVGYYASAVDTEKMRFDLSLCIGTPDKKQLFCLEQSPRTIHADKLPAEIPVFGGKLTIRAVLRDESGNLRLHYALTAPVTTKAVGLYRASFTAPLHETLFFRDH